MGIILESNNEKNKLQERIASDLREKAQSSTPRRGRPDFIEDTEDKPF